MDTLVTIHSWVRWLVLLALVASVGLGISRHLKSAAWEPGVYSAAVITLDVQVLIGFIVFFGNSGWDQGTFIGMIHPLFMLLALAVAHVGLRYARSHEEASPDRTVAFSSFVALVLVVAAVPWDRLTG